MATVDAQLSARGEDGQLRPLRVDGVDALLVADEGTHERLDRLRNRPVLVPARGTAEQVAEGHTRVVATLVAGEATGLLGFTATGDADGVFRLAVDGAVLVTSRIHQLQRTATLMLPASLPLAAGQTVTVAVTCMAAAGTTYEATIFGEAHG